MDDGRVIKDSLYLYAPNKIAPVILAAVFFVSLIGHVYQCCHYRSWKLIGLHPACAAFFVTGFVLREYGAFNYVYDKAASDAKIVLIIYIMSQVFIYICPPLLELSNYHVLSRVLAYVPSNSPIAPNKIFVIFGGLMSLVEVFNGLGVAYSSNPTGAQQATGRILVLVALAIQMFVIGSFFVISTIFYIRCQKSRASHTTVPTLTYVLWLSMGLILVRSIYRIVQYTGNTNRSDDSLQAEQNITSLERCEWYFYVFEAAPMLANSLLWNIFSPGRFLPRSRNCWIDENGIEVTIPEPMAGQDGQSSSMTLLNTIMDIFTLGVWGHVVASRQEMPPLKVHDSPSPGAV
ncbi:hypothetical protein N7512_008832 [Penicillium capsulatum]|nr:hypothetical protein N7512_008832 [Penicillium capsulatum]